MRLNDVLAIVTAIDVTESEPYRLESVQRTIPDDDESYVVNTNFKGELKQFKTLDEWTNA